ncbi:MAG: hypothetical protein QOJ07_3098, partial [Thermoleophilaceae bacterium]|nr:hypothetical protein [Thermoleophilaceae bacterium]
HERVLAAMASRYAEVASELGFPPAGAPAAGDLVRVDARGDPAEVVARVESELRARLA